MNRDNWEGNCEQIHSLDSLVLRHLSACSSLGALRDKESHSPGAGRVAGRIQGVLCISHLTPLRKNNFWITPDAQTPGAAWLPTQPPLQLEYLPFPGSFWHVPVELLQGRGFSVGNEGHRDIRGSSAEANICIRAPTAAFPPGTPCPPPQSSPSITNPF